MADLIDIFRRMRKLTDTEQSDLDQINNYTTKSQFRTIKGLVKERKIEITKNSINVGGLINNLEVPTLTLIKDLEEIKNTITKINNDIDSKVSDNLFIEFAKVIHDKTDTLIAPNIVGFQNVKKAVALQLFTPEHIHILLLGDPGTGKTDILNAATDLAPISSMGLGSGTSGVGLAVTIKGKEVKKGLLPNANNGLCAIDELNLMKEDSRASLYNAMEKGFVSYDKGGNSYKFDAKISVLATANPKGDKFTGKTITALKKQLPFDAALLSRFHLTFLIKKHNEEAFKKITKALINKQKLKLSTKELHFLTDYVKKAHEIPEVKIPKQFENDIVEFVGNIKKNENKYLTEISPRLVVGFTRLAKASARMELREEVNANDIILVQKLITDSLTI